ncbi:hypothetical protein Bca101_025195 [Brassica carinata]
MQYANLNDDAISALVHTRVINVSKETMGLDTKSQEKLEAKQERGPSAGQDKGTKNRAPMAPFDDTERGRMKTTKPALTYNRFDSLLSLSDD